MLSVPARRAVVVGVGSHLPERPEDPLDRAASVHTAQCEAKVGLSCAVHQSSCHTLPVHS